MGIHQDGRAVSQAHPDTDNSRISGGLGAVVQRCRCLPSWHSAISPVSGEERSVGRRRTSPLEPKATASGLSGA